MTTETITISFLGVSERSRFAYQFFFDSIKQFRCELIDDYRKAQLCLVDTDTYNIQKQYKELVREHPDKYILVLSIQDHSCIHDKEFFIKKPVKKEALLELLKQAYLLITGKSASNIETSKEIQEAPIVIQKTQKTKTKNITPKKTKQTSDIKELNKPVNSAAGNTVLPIKSTRKTSAANAGRLLNIESEKYFVGQQHERYFVGQHPDIDINDPKQLKNIFYEPNKLLQTIVEQTCVKSRKSGQVVQLNILNQIFYFDAQNKRVYSTVGLANIRPLCVIEHNNQIAYSVKDNKFRDELHDCFRISRNHVTEKKLVTQSWCMECFIWLVTLWCSRGRIPQGVDLTQPVYLKQWPNLTRLGSIPHAVSIAALIYDRPLTLTEVAKQLGIEQRYVFAFSSACKSLGLLDVSRQHVDKLFVTEKQKRHENKSIMSKLLAKLVNFSDKSAMNEIAKSIDKQRDSQ